jgi:hypothetical protein
MKIKHVTNRDAKTTFYRQKAKRGTIKNRTNHVEPQTLKRQKWRRIKTFCFELQMSLTLTSWRLTYY